MLLSGCPLYQAFSLGRFILLLLVSFWPVLLVWGCWASSINFSTKFLTKSLGKLFFFFTIIFIKVKSKLPGIILKQEVWYMWLLLYYLKSGVFFTIVFKGCDQSFLLAFIYVFLDSLCSIFIHKDYFFLFSPLISYSDISECCFLCWHSCCFSEESVLPFFASPAPPIPECIVITELHRGSDGWVVECLG